ncbi:hypothetical protein [Paraglaciecola sp.]|uniref:hypothetical protein n=1 Tax=Paraglaciecola sp. TaxID=1920173 RepID=UPI003EF5B7FE
MQEVKPVYDQFSPKMKKHLLQVRTWIFEIAQTNDDIGHVQECLKWQEPSYVTSGPKSGTTLRLSQVDTEHYGLFVHCQTSLIEEFKLVYPDLTYNKTRGVVFAANLPIKGNIIKQFIFMALTYHQRK